MWQYFFGMTSVVSNDMITAPLWDWEVCQNQWKLTQNLILFVVCFILHWRPQKPDFCFIANLKLLWEDILWICVTSAIKISKIIAFITCVEFIKAHKQVKTHRGMDQFETFKYQTDTPTTPHLAFFPTCLQITFQGHIQTLSAASGHHFDGQFHIAVDSLH